MSVKDQLYVSYRNQILTCLGYYFVSVASPFESRQRSQQATPGTSPKHLNDQKCSTCTVHQGILNDKFDTKTKSSPLVSSASSNAQTTDNRCGGRASKETTGRARIDTSDLDSLKGDYQRSILFFNFHAHCQTLNPNPNPQ